MKKVLLLVLIGVGILTACSDQPSDSADQSFTVGIVIPIEHPAMDEITKGFEQTLSELVDTPVKFDVLRAQGDMNLQRAMIQQLKNKQVDLIAPIATATTQMTTAMIHNIPIVGLAAILPASSRKRAQLALIDDEITPTQTIRFIHDIYPDKKEFTIVYANTDKIIPQVKEAVLAGKQLGITIHKRMITTLPDLYSVANSLSAKTQGIVVLKDVLVASGIETLVNVANRKGILLITSDDGTVENGAGFALGVKEYQIGVEGAKVAKQILVDKVKANTIPVVKMTHLSVFINKASLKKQHQDLHRIEQQAKRHGYQVVELGKNQTGKLK